MTLLTPLRTLTGTEPVILAPYEHSRWRTYKRTRQCEIYAPKFDRTVLGTAQAAEAFTVGL